MGIPSYRDDALDCVPPRTATENVAGNCLFPIRICLSAVPNSTSKPQFRALNVDILCYINNLRLRGGRQNIRTSRTHCRAERSRHDDLLPEREVWLRVLEFRARDGRYQYRHEEHRRSG